MHRYNDPFYFALHSDGFGPSLQEALANIDRKFLIRGGKVEQVRADRRLTLYRIVGFFKGA